MVLEHLLSQKRDAILGRWLELIIDAYPAETAWSLRQKEDRFVNPVGYTISREMVSLYDGLLHVENTNRFVAPLDNIIRIRSVQDFSPAEVVAFVFLLKKAVREELEKEVRENQLSMELLEFESRIDELALLAVGVYMDCREKIHEIRVNELKAERERMSRLLERVNPGYDKGGEVPR
jgi:hypothetical protein